MRFARKVIVTDPSGERVLFSTHPERARAMLRDGEAVRTHGSTVRRIRLTSAAGRPHGPCTPPSIRDYAGRPMTYRERLMEQTDDGREVVAGVVLQFRRIPRWAWPIYRAALVDCLPAAAQAEIRRLFGG